MNEKFVNESYNFLFVTYLSLSVLFILLISMKKQRGRNKQNRQKSADNMRHTGGTSDIIQDEVST